MFEFKENKRKTFKNWLKNLKTIYYLHNHSHFKVVLLFAKIQVYKIYKSTNIIGVVQFFLILSNVWQIML